MIARAGMRAWLLAFVLAALSTATAPARAEDVGVFYQAYAIVTGTDMRQRPWGMAQCLREVLVKVSGDPRLKDDPRSSNWPRMPTALSRPSTMST